MFSSKADRITIAELNLRIDDLTRANEELVKKLTAIKESEPVSNCSVVCDFKSMKAFSIERITSRESGPRTIIGYVKPENTLGEWFLECNEEQHEKLIKEFLVYLKTKK